MTRRLTLLAEAMLLGMLIGALPAFAQLGAGRDECTATWGEPLSQPPTNSPSMLWFNTKEGLLVSVGLVEGRVAHVGYQHKDGLSPDTVASVLALNATEGTEWMEWSTPGFRADDPVKQWMRTDELAFARYDGQQLLVTSGAWNTQPRDDVAVDTAPAAAADAAPAEPVPSTDVSDTAKSLRFAGWWCSGSREDWTAALFIAENGTARWRRQSGEDVSLLWRVKAGTGGAVTELVLATEAGGVLGELNRASNGSLAFTPAPGAQGWMPHDFSRVDAMPEHSAKPLRTQLPEVGQTKSEVLLRAGNPRSAFSLGVREELTYPWGRVMLEKGKVVAVSVDD